MERDFRHHFLSYLFWRVLAFACIIHSLNEKRSPKKIKSAARGNQAGRGTAQNSAVWPRLVQRGVARRGRAQSVSMERYRTACLGAVRRDQAKHVALQCGAR